MRILGGFGYVGVLQQTQCLVMRIGAWHKQQLLRAGKSRLQRCAIIEVALANLNAKLGKRRGFLRLTHNGDNLIGGYLSLE
ncbi:hypothetical protein D3C86_2051550 [compost metagenome]